jgi:hypothetical protein
VSATTLREHPTTFFTGEWTDLDDGSLWLTRNLSHERYGMTWPRLLYLRVEVTAATQGIKVPGKVRAKKVEAHYAGGRGWRGKTVTQRPWVYHAEDVKVLGKPPNAAEKARAIERVQHSDGRWFLSPGAVVRRLGIDASLVPQWKRYGIPVLGRKPLKAELWNRPHVNRIRDYWAESLIDEIETARAKLATPPEGLSRDGAAGAISTMQQHRLRKRGELAVKEVLALNPEGIPCHRKMLDTDDVQTYQQSRLTDPLPPGYLTVRDAAEVLRVGENTILAMIGDTLHAVRGKVLCKHRRQGRPWTQLRDGWHIRASDVEREFKQRFPGVRWPLPSHREQAPPANRVQPKRRDEAFKPHWDEASRTLFLGDDQLRQYHRYADNQIRLLQAFQGAGWPERVASPFGKDVAALLQTIKDLHGGISGSKLRFGRTDKGMVATWRIC